MKHTGQGAFAALLALTLISPFTAHAQDVPEQKTGFFRQLGKGLADTGKQMVGLKPNAGTKAGSQELARSTRPPAAPEGCPTSSRLTTTSRPSSGSWTGPESR